MVHRRFNSAVLAMALPLSGPPLAQSVGPSPVIRISIYAPLQIHSPLHIISLKYDDHGIHFAFSNESDKEVVGVTVIATESVPTACAETGKTQLGKARPGVGGGGDYHLRLGPHEKSPILEEAPIPVGALVGVAWKSEVANLQVQFGVVEVDFADGTKWKRQEAWPQSQFDPSLVDADRGPCSDALVVGRYLREVTIKLDRSMEKTTYVNDGGEGGPPHLSFQCRIDESMTVCPFS